MHSITAALENLQGFLTDTIPDAPGIRVFDVPFPLHDTFDPLAWLCTQPLFPQFYWQQRSGAEEAAALGAVISFTALSDARDFLQRQSQLDVRIWGMNAFNVSTGQLFLPRLEWRRAGDKATLRLTLFSNSSLRADAEQALELLGTLKPPRTLPALNLTLQHERHYPGREDWRRLITLATDTIATGALDKVVLARASDLDFDREVSAGSVMATSRRLNQHCFHFLMAFEAGRAFLGSTPERLWRRDGDVLLTEALAGTVASHTDAQQAAQRADWLMQDDKNQRENQLVVDDISQRLRQAVFSLEVSSPEVIRLRKVQHLRRRIRARLRKEDDALCLHQLQPTAAVAGLPRQQARDFIAQHEPFDREWYAGSAGFLSLHHSEFCVALRSASITKTTVRLYAGAGIVRGSDPEQEWLEIDNKAAGLRSLLLDE